MLDYAIISQDLPIISDMKKKLFYSIVLLFIHCSTYNWFSQQATHTVIMINPAGDAAHAGRLIEDSFERGITLQIAEFLKHTLEDRNPYITVLLTRMPGEIIEPLHNAQCANRIAPFVYISIHCYQEKKPVPQLFTYIFSYGNNFFSPSSDLTLYRYDHAHLVNKKKSHEYSQLFWKSLKELSTNRQFFVHEIIAAPFAPLLGISCPAFGLEIGLAQKKDWHILKSSLVHSIESVINHYIKIN